MPREVVSRISLGLYLSDYASEMRAAISPKTHLGRQHHLLDDPMLQVSLDYEQSAREELAAAVMGLANEELPRIYSREAILAFCEIVLGKFAAKQLLLLNPSLDPMLLPSLCLRKPSGEMISPGDRYEDPDNPWFDDARLKFAPWFLQYNPAAPTMLAQETRIAGFWRSVLDELLLDDARIFGGAVFETPAGASLFLKELCQGPLAESPELRPFFAAESLDAQAEEAKKLAPYLRDPHGDETVLPLLIRKAMARKAISASHLRRAIHLALRQNNWMQGASPMAFLGRVVRLRGLLQTLAGQPPVPAWLLQVMALPDLAFDYEGLAPPRDSPKRGRPRKAAEPARTSAEPRTLVERLSKPEVERLLAEVEQLMVELKGNFAKVAARLGISNASLRVFVVQHSGDSFLNWKRKFAHGPRD